MSSKGSNSLQGRNKVLLVEDTRFFASAVTKSIEERTDLQVVVAATLAETKAILKARAEEFSLAILDLHLPDAMDGEVVDYVVTHEIPILVFTAEVSEVTQEDVLSKKVIDYVIKDGPASLYRLAALIERLHANRNIKVLAVDDSRTARNYVCDLLRQYQFQVVDAKTGEEALDVLKEHEDIRLIITDHNMSGMSGVDFVKEVRRTFPDRKHAIIGMSTSGSRSLSARFLKHGADDFLNKPFLREEFFCRVSRNVELLERIEDTTTKHEELSALNDQKDRFLSIIGHDLKGPFNAILGFSEVLATSIDKLDREKIISYAEYVHSASARAENILSDLLEWSHAQTGMAKCNPEPMSISETVDDALAFCRPQALAKGMEFVFDEPGNWVGYADSRMIDLVLRNLVSNAIKFSPKGAQIEVSFSHRGSMIAISVIDHGVGMDQKTLSGLFRIDNRISSAGTEGEEGTGLGLHLCKTFVELNGGEIDVTSVPGHGSTFTFTVVDAAHPANAVYRAS